MSWFGSIQLSVKRIWKRRKFIRKRRKYYIRLRSRRTYIKEQSFLREIQKTCSIWGSSEKDRICLSNSCHNIYEFQEQGLLGASALTKADAPVRSTKSPSAVCLRCQALSNRSLRRKPRKGKKSSKVRGTEFERSLESLYSNYSKPVVSHSDSPNQTKESHNRRLLQSGDKKYHKYIPVSERYGIFYPKGSIDHHFPSCWLEIQSWYVRYITEKFVPSSSPKSVGSSKSDVSLASSRDSQDSLSSNQRSKPAEGRSTLVENEVSVVHNAALREHPRFGMFSNLEYLDYVRQLTHYQGRVRVQFLVGVSCHPHQCHIKTNMILTCLRSFFHNGGDLEVMWTRSLIQQLPIKSLRLVFNRKLASILAMQLAEARAILFVTQEAAILLRHPDTAFLTTLARAAGVTREQLVVLPFDLGSGQTSERLELFLADQEEEDSEEDDELASSLPR